MNDFLFSKVVLESKADLECVKSCLEVLSLGPSARRTPEDMLVGLTRDLLVIQPKASVDVSPFSPVRLTLASGVFDLLRKAQVRAGLCNPPSSSSQSKHQKSIVLNHGKIIFTLTYCCSLLPVDTVHFRNS